jgi:cytochrome P450
MAEAIENPSKLPLPPGDFGLPWLGEPPRLFDLEYMMEQYRLHGPVFKTRILGRKIAVFMGAEANRFLLSTGMKHFAWREGWPPTFKELLGESLFVQDGAEHRAKRRLIMPAFHREALHNYQQTMEDITIRNLERFEKLGTFRWADENKHLTFEIASKLLIGTDAGADAAHLSQLFTKMTKGFVNVPTPWAWTPYGKALQARDELLAYIEKAVLHRQANPTNDALGLMMKTRDEDGVQLTLDELKTQTLLLLFAGHETSASMITSLVMLLSQNPDVLQKRAKNKSNSR